MSNVYVHFSQISFPAQYSVVNLRLESHSLRFREVISSYTHSSCKTLYIILYTPFSTIAVIYPLYHLYINLYYFLYSNTFFLAYVYFVIRGICIGIKYKITFIAL